MMASIKQRIENLEQEANTSFSPTKQTSATNDLRLLSERLKMGGKRLSDVFVTIDL